MLEEEEKKHVNNLKIKLNNTIRVLEYNNVPNDTGKYELKYFNVVQLMVIHSIILLAFNKRIQEEEKKLFFNQMNVFCIIFHMYNQK